MLALLTTQSSWLSGPSLANSSSKTPTLHRISVENRRLAYLAHLASVPVERHSRSARRELRASNKVEEEPDSTTDSHQDRDAQQRVLYRSDVDDEIFVDYPTLDKHCDSLTLRQEGNDGDYITRRRTSIFEYYWDSRINNALEAYQMGRRPSSSSSTQIDLGFDFKVDQDSIVPIVAQAISDPTPVHEEVCDALLVEFPPPPEENLRMAFVCPRTPRWHCSQHHWRSLPGTLRTVPINPREIENLVLAPAHQEP